MGRYSGKTCRLLSMLFLTGSFFLVEIIVGYITNSVALVADSFHMLSDVVALIVGFASIRIARWPSRINTYGWVRSEILGALFNAVFLLALCFSILVEALKRIVQTEPIEQPILMLTVGAAGLVVNIIGLFLFHGHAHGHSHGGKKSDEPSLEESQALFNGVEVSRESASVHVSGANGEPGNSLPLVHIELTTQHGHSHSGDSKKGNSTSQMNMKGVFLHVLGDALGSVIVIISSLVIWFAEGDWRFYVDPAMSVALVVIIFCTTIPLLKETALILLQTAPSSVDQDILKAELEKFDGVLGVHEFHLWQLTSNRLVLSAHITCHNLRDYMTIATHVKQYFHSVGIHSTTIQPEFVDNISTMDVTCSLRCRTDDCLKDTCCGTTPRTYSRASREVSASGSPAVSQSTPALRQGALLLAASQVDPPTAASSAPAVVSVKCPSEVAGDTSAHSGDPAPASDRETKI